MRGALGDGTTLRGLGRLVQRGAASGGITEGLPQYPRAAAVQDPGGASLDS